MWRKKALEEITRDKYWSSGQVMKSGKEKDALIPSDPHIEDKGRTNYEKFCWINLKEVCNNKTDMWHFWPHRNRVYYSRPQTLRSRGRFKAGDSTTEVTVSVSFTKNGFSSGFFIEGWVWAETAVYHSEEKTSWVWIQRQKSVAAALPTGFLLWMRIESKEQVPENFRWEHSFPAPDVFCPGQWGGTGGTSISVTLLVSPCTLLLPMRGKFLDVSEEGTQAKRSQPGGIE